MERLPFLEDIYPQNLLYAVTIRSPVAKGQLKSIQIPALPEDFTLVTAKDIPGKNFLTGTKVPILSDGQLSYIGEPVAILLGPDKTKLDEIASRCTVIAEEETPVFNVKEGELAAEREIITGNTVSAMTSSEMPSAYGFENDSVIVTGSYKTGIQEHWYAEPIGAITFYMDEYEKKKKKTDNYHSPLVVMTATQWPFHVKRAVLQCLGLNADSVSIKPTSLNLHMDGKLWYPSLISCHSALCTFLTKRPVRFILKREEDFFYTPKRCGSDIHIASIIDEKGNITSAAIDIYVNLGAYAVNEKETLDQICLGALGLYNYKNIKLTAKAIRTNIPPQGAFCGFGIAQGLFAAERNVTLISNAVNKDPALWRQDNINTKAIMPVPQPKIIPSGSKLIDTALKMSDYSRKWASYELLRQSRKGKTLQKGENPRGIGITAGFQGNSPLYVGEDNGVYTVEVTLTKESVVEIITSITTSEDYGRIWQKVAKETMGVESDKVKIITENALDSGPSCSSRNITAITRLVEKCCLAIQKQRFRDPLPITVRRSIKPQKGGIRGGIWDVHDISGFTRPGLAAAVVEVTIDLVECIPIVRGIWLSVDGGKIVSENRAKRSLARGTAHALGWAYTENIEYINGSLSRNQYENFKIFSPMKIPPIHINFLREDTLAEPKGIGDLPFTCIPSAFIQAVSQAMDHCFKSIPLKRNDIWEMVRWGQHDN
jgi:CO/xanthine dehydrogenase Mo-binding subunit